MKRCPSCGRTYDDASAGFCLSDGTRLESDEMIATIRSEPERQAQSSPPPASSPNFNDQQQTPAPQQQAWTPPPQSAPAPTVSWQQLQQQQRQSPPQMPQDWSNQPAAGAGIADYAGAAQAASSANSANNTLALVSAIVGAGTLVAGIYVLFTVFD